MAPTAYAEEPFPVECCAWPQLTTEGVLAQPTCHKDSLSMMEPETVLSWVSSSIAAVTFVAVTIIEIFMSFKLSCFHLLDCSSQVVVVKASSEPRARADSQVILFARAPA